LGFVPNIIGAVFVFIIGLTIAKIVRALITTALNAVDFGKLLGTAQSGFDRATGGVTSAGRPAERAPEGGPAAPAAATSAGSPSSPASRRPVTLASVASAAVLTLASSAALQIAGIRSHARPCGLPIWPRAPPSRASTEPPGA